MFLVGSLSEKEEISRSDVVALTIKISVIMFILVLGFYGYIGKAKINKNTLLNYNKDIYK